MNLRVGHQLSCFAPDFELEIPMEIAVAFFCTDLCPMPMVFQEFLGRDLLAALQTSQESQSFFVESFRELKSLGILSMKILQNLVHDRFVDIHEL